MSTADVLSEEVRAAALLFHRNGCTLGACTCDVAHREAVIRSALRTGYRRALEDAADAYPFNFRDPLAPGQWQVLCWLRDRANETRLCKCGHPGAKHNGDQKGCRALGPIGLGLGCDCSGRFQPPGASR